MSHIFRGLSIFVQLIVSLVYVTLPRINSQYTTPSQPPSPSLPHPHTPLTSPSLFSFPPTYQPWQPLPYASYLTSPSLFRASSSSLGQHFTTVRLPQRKNKCVNATTHSKLALNTNRYSRLQSVEIKKLYCEFKENPRVQRKPVN